MSLIPGTRIGSYEVTAQIGAGGMGEVYRARDTKLNRDDAIKVLPENVAGDAARLACFHRGAQVLAALNHHNIAHIHGYEETGGVHALVIELVPGPTLAQQLASLPAGSRGLPLSDTLAIALQIAEALEAAHDQGIVHRDLKPDNVKIAPSGIVKVLDFGIATIVAITSEQASAPTAIDSATAAGAVMGTAPYMSPEQARGLSVDKRTDIWAFGCVLFEMLTGRRCFPGDTPADSLAGVIARAPDWSLVQGSIPSGLLRLLHLCLEKDPRGRLRDIRDARLEILQIQRGDERVDTAGHGRLGGRRIVWIASLVLVFAVAIAANRFLPSSREGDKKIVSRTVISLPRDETLHRGWEPELRHYPGWKAVPHDQSDDDSPSQQLVVVQNWYEELKQRVPVK